MEAETVKPRPSILDQMIELCRQALAEQAAAAASNETDRNDSTEKEETAQ